MNTPIDFDEIRRSFKSGDIYSASDDELQAAVGHLANKTITNDAVRHEAIIMADAIHSILLRHLLDQQEKRNQKAQFWFMVLAIAGVLGSIVQVGVALL